MKEELWKPIAVDDLYKRYIISNRGVIKSLFRNKEKIIQTHKDRSGYVVANIGIDKKRKHYFVHRLVAMTFIGLQDEKEINHKDGNKQNNSVDNLEWVTHSENHFHRWGHKDYIGKKRIKKPRLRLYEYQVEEIRKLINEGNFTCVQIAEKYNVNVSRIYRIKQNRTWLYTK